MFFLIALIVVVPLLAYFLIKFLVEEWKREQSMNAARQRLADTRARCSRIQVLCVGLPAMKNALSAMRRYQFATPEEIAEYQENIRAGEQELEELVKMEFGGNKNE